MEIVLFAITVILFASRMKWKITTLSLLYYLEKNRYKRPSEEDVKECTEFVVKNIIKDLIER